MIIAFKRWHSRFAFRSRGQRGKPGTFGLFLIPATICTLRRDGILRRDGSKRVSSLRAFHRPFEAERCMTAIFSGIGTGRTTGTMISNVTRAWRARPQSTSKSTLSTTTSQWESSISKRCRSFSCRLSRSSLSNLVLHDLNERAIMRPRH